MQQEATGLNPDSKRLEENLLIGCMTIPLQYLDRLWIIFSIGNSKVLQVAR